MSDLASTMDAHSPKTVGQLSADRNITTTRGALVVNADDWGRDRDTTDRTLECVVRRAVSAVSAMVFMEDSQRAADIAQERKINAGLHLNLDTQFSASGVSPRLTEHLQRLARYLRRHRLGHILFHPGLTGSFEYVVKAQLEEFERLYSEQPKRIDGHHHAHLCANVITGKLLPEGTIVRRNFSFRSGEKSFANRLYRSLVDRKLSHRHKMTDLFFSLPPLEPHRLRHIFTAAQESLVELETHPVRAEEFAFLANGEIFRWIDKSYIRSFDSIAPRMIGHDLRTMAVVSQ
jgi:chitin disaccharide deacetylase